MSKNNSPFPTTSQTAHVSGFASRGRQIMGRNETPDEAQWGVMPIYADDPHQWIQRIKAMMAGKMRRRGIALGYTKDRIINDTLKLAEKREVLGDLRLTWRCFSKTYRDYMKSKAKSPKDRLQAYGKALGLCDEKIAEIMRMPGNWRMPAQYEDAMGQAAKALQASKPEAAPVEAPKEPSELDEWFPREDGKPMTEQDANAALNDQLSKTAHDQDELTVWSAVTAPESSRQFAAFNHFQRELAVIDSKANISEHILKALDGIPLGLHIAEHGIQDTCDKLQSYLDNQPNSIASNIAPKTPEIEAQAIPVPTADNRVTDKPVQAEEKRSFDTMPESPIVVYPMSTGSIEYKGIRFCVTLRIGGTFAMAIALMDEFAAHKELIAPNCIVQVQPSIVPQPSAPTLPPPSTTQTALTGEVDSAGRKPGQTGTTVITGVKVVKDEGKTIIELWAAGQYAEHRLQQPNEHTFVERLTDWSALEVGTKYPVQWVSDWVVSSKRAQKGKQNYYLNVTGIRDNAAQKAA